MKPPMQGSAFNSVGSVFVYGTLKQGQCRDQCWPHSPISIKQAWILGNLFGRKDYPALCRGDGCVAGELWTFEGHQLQRVLEVLDEIEGTNENSPSDLYHRDLVSVHLHEASKPTPPESVAAYTYFYNRDPLADGFVSVRESNGCQSWP